MTGKSAKFPHAVFLGLLLSAGGVFAQDAVDGATVYLKYNCQICHGEDGRGGVRSGYPAISGQDQRYLIQQITDIRDGVRENGQTKVMRPVIKQLGDREIEAIADWLSVGNVK